MNCNPAVTPIATGTKLSKEEGGSKVDPTLYKRLVGSLMYLTATQHDIMIVVSLLLRFIESPKNTHQQSGNRILRYIAGTTNFGIQYISNSNFKLIGYTDIDFASFINDRKSTYGYVFRFGLGLVAWDSKKQAIVTLSSAEEKYVVATVAACQTMWMRRTLSKLQHEQDKPTQIYCDNKSAIAL